MYSMAPAFLVPFLIPVDGHVGTMFVLAVCQMSHSISFVAVHRGDLFSSPQRSSQASSLGCNSLPNSQSEPSQQDVFAASQEIRKAPAERSANRLGPHKAAEPPTPNRTEARQRAPSDSTVTSSPSNKVRCLLFTSNNA